MPSLDALGGKKPALALGGGDTPGGATGAASGSAQSRGQGGAPTSSGGGFGGLAGLEEKIAARRREGGIQPGKAVDRRERCTPPGGDLISDYYHIWTYVLEIDYK